MSNINRKRPASTAREDSTPLHCKICLNLFSEPYITICGHTFCRKCITASIQHNPQCPICETSLELKKAKTILCPNHTVASVLEQQINPRRIMTMGQAVHQQADANGAELVQQIIETEPLSLDSIRNISEAVKKKQLELELNDQHIRNLLLHDFLEKMIEKRECASKQLLAELEVLKQDKQQVMNTLCGQLSPGSIQRLVPDSSHQLPCCTSGDQEQSGILRSAASSPAQLGPNLAEQLGRYRRRIGRHISSLESAYFGGSSGKNALRVPDQQLGSVPKVGLEEFSSTLRQMYQFDDITTLATLNYNLESSSAQSIVSSIEFDKDGEFFVIAGVTKKIKLYNYEAVVNFEGDLHYPVEQLICNSKISNVSYNPYNKNMLASSDYEGTVQLWDTAAAQSIRTFREHEKRCWTVQFNNVDPHLMASGSDDGKVKLWTLNAPQSVCTIDARVNVCCVYFSPKYRNQLVFGSSDHCVHLYDIRQPSKPLNIFRGHRKAVSYVKYCNENEVVSASTDSNLRLWDVNTGCCLQTMRGHQNEKNFVGLATDGTHVMCGSENNRLYLYYKMVPDPLLSFDCVQGCSVDSPPLTADSAGSQNCATDQPQGQSGGDFVSAVCWKKNSNVILAANSQGQTFVLQLQ